MELVIIFLPNEGDVKFHFMKMKVNKKMSTPRQKVIPYHRQSHMSVALRQLTQWKKHIREHVFLGRDLQSHNAESLYNIPIEVQ